MLIRLKITELMCFEYLQRVFENDRDGNFSNQVLRSTRTHRRYRWLVFHKNGHLLRETFKKNTSKRETMCDLHLNTPTSHLYLHSNAHNDRNEKTPNKQK